MSHFDEKVDAESHNVPELSGRRHSAVEKGPGHIDVKEVDEHELEAAEDMALAEGEFT